MIAYRSFSFLLIIIHIVCGDLTSTIQFLNMGTDFIPINSIELISVYTTVPSMLSCAMLCNQNSECRTIVFDRPSCRLYESYLNTGSVIESSSPNSVVGAVNYDNVYLSSDYNQSCDHCYLNRYLVCQNDTCQCPLHTFWDGQNTCLNQLFLNSSSTCQADNWCREDLNLTCVCGNCQYPNSTSMIVI